MHIHIHMFFCILSFIQNMFQLSLHVSLQKLSSFWFAYLLVFCLFVCFCFNFLATRPLRKRIISSISSTNRILKSYLLRHISWVKSVLNYFQYSVPLKERNLYLNVSKVKFYLTLSLKVFELIIFNSILPFSNL